MSGGGGITHVIGYSGGLSSHLAAHRIIEEVGADRCVLLFADTKSEDADLYRFIREGSEALGCRLVTVCDGRTIWQVFRDERFLGNSRIDPCSKILKRRQLDRWTQENAPGSVPVIGYTVCESRRWERYLAHRPNARAPLMESPTLKAEDVPGEFADLFPSIAPPRLYALGASHNNCGGGCIKAGQKHFDWLRRTLPATYAEWEREEQSLRDMLGDVAILTDRRGGKKKPLSLRQFRERMECGGTADAGGRDCACMEPAFTLLELLVVIAIIGIVLAIALPALRHSREAARNAPCLANIRTIGQLATVYHDANRSRWPRQIAQLELDDGMAPLTCPRDRTPDALRSHGLWEPAFGMAAGVTETPTLEARVEQASPPGLLMVSDIRAWCDRQKAYRNGTYTGDNAPRRIK